VNKLAVAALEAHHFGRHDALHGRARALRVEANLEDMFVTLARNQDQRAA
jgi:hypothetical protein